MIDEATFRNVMAQWPSGVTVVTTLTGDGERHGMTASSFSSVSLDPPLVSICLTTTLYSHELIARSGVFGISVLAKDQTDIGRRFAGMEPGVSDRFDGAPWSTAVTGVPLLDSALGWFDCRVVNAYPGGDHTIFVGEVVAGRAAGRSAPLLFHSRGWGQFADVLPDVATLSDSGVVAGLAAQSPVRDGVPVGVAVATGVAAAGVRVRLADLAGASSLAAAEAMLPHSAPLASSSMLVADRAQADLAIDAGVGVVEMMLDPTAPGAAAGLLAQVDGIEGRTAVHLVDPFDIGRLDHVLQAIRELSAAGVLEIGLPDVAGRATPLHVRSLLQEAVAQARPVPLRMRLHDRDRLGLVKAITALKSGIRHFDSTLAGLDGAVATEDLIRLLHEVDVDTPADTTALVGLADEVRSLTASTRAGHPTELPHTTSIEDAADIVGATG